MKKKKNRRTLKKRIRRIISLSTLLTVLFLSGVIISLVLLALMGFAEDQAEFVRDSIQEGSTSVTAVNPIVLGRIDDFIPYARDISKVYTTIVVEDKLMFSNEDKGSDRLSGYFKNFKSTKPIYDSDKKEIGTVTVRVNPRFLLMILVPLLLVITFINLIALIISNIISRFLAIPIIKPLKQLETKVKAIAEGDQETAVSTQIILKKPLREIESLADSTNNIMNKLKRYNEILEEQKEVLENQNTELEVQNEELIESKIEIQKHQAQLVQSEKMASVGLLTAAITHEINTPIGAINSNAQIEDMLLSGLISDPVVQTNEELSLIVGQLKEVNDVNLMACSRIIEIIKSLKTFSRLDQAEFQEADINEGIKSVLILTNNLLKRRIIVHEELGEIPHIKCFPGQLNQVFMNIIVNASQAIEGDGEIFIKTFRKDNDIFINIRDTGTGIKEEDISKIFDPGFTTKGVGVGLGLGLYISYNIIQNHKGEISVKSESGKGAEFIIRIPIDNDKT